MSHAEAVHALQPAAGATAALVRFTGAQATIMKDLGHFPMRENPEKFIGYLLPVLEEIRTTKRANAA